MSNQENDTKDPMIDNQLVSYVKMVGIDVDRVIENEPDAESKANQIMSVIVNVFEQIQNKLMFVQPPGCNIGLSPNVIPIETRTDISCNKYRIVNVQDNACSYVIGRRNFYNDGQRNLYRVEKPRALRAKETYLFNARLNKLTLTGVSSLVIQLPASISGIDIIMCTDVKIMVEYGAQIRAEYSDNIRVYGPAVIKCMCCSDVSLNGELLNVTPFTIDSGFRISLPSGFIRID